jgi:linoleoyl-CoA desaturase
MFPDVPGMRYAEMAVKVREICERYGQHYNTGSFTKQFSSVVGRIFKYALPFGTKAEAIADSVVAKAAEIVPMSKVRLPSFISRIAA